MLLMSMPKSQKDQSDALVQLLLDYLQLLRLSANNLEILCPFAFNMW